MFTNILKHLNHRSPGLTPTGPVLVLSILFIIFLVNLPDSLYLLLPVVAIAGLYGTLRFIRSVASTASTVVRARLPHRPPPRPPVRTRADRLQDAATTAQQDFDAEVALIETMKLDEDEQDVLRMRAKQRLMRKLSQVLE